MNKLYRTVLGSQQNWEVQSVPSHLLEWGKFLHLYFPQSSTVSCVQWALHATAVDCGFCHLAAGGTKQGWLLAVCFRWECTVLEWSSERGPRRQIITKGYQLCDTSLATQRPHFRGFRPFWIIKTIGEKKHNYCRSNNKNNSNNNNILHKQCLKLDLGLG